MERGKQRKPRVIAIGDVHGCVDELRALLRKCEYSPGDLVLFLGDLVSKGPASAEVVKLAREIGAIGVRGNHDFEVIRFAELIAKGEERGIGNEHYRIAKQLSKTDVKWLSNLPWYIHSRDLNAFFVHAGFVSGIKMKKQKGNANFFSHVANTLAQLTNARSSWDVCLLSRNDTTSAVGVPKSPEEPLDGLPHIFKANRICGQCNYVLSQGACRRILRSGFHQAMFCIDDFISAITVGHFREDVMRHPAVGQIRTQGGALSMYIDVSAENFFSVETCPTSDTDYPVVPDGAEESNHSVSGRARWHDKH